MVSNSRVSLPHTRRPGRPREEAESRTMWRKLELWWVCSAGADREERGSKGRQPLSVTPPETEGKGNKYLGFCLFLSSRLQSVPPISGICPSARDKAIKQVRVLCAAE